MIDEESCRANYVNSSDNAVACSVPRAVSIEWLSGAAVAALCAIGRTTKVGKNDKHCKIMRDKKTIERLENVFNAVVEAIMDESGIGFEQLANSRSDNCVTARVVLVDTLMRRGMSETLIVEISGMSQQRVNSLKNAIRWRLKGLFAKILRDEVWKRVCGLAEF